ncbi:MAG: tRNA uridine(34) 5-carboxymethylaminomethyl modification radical SAM/GNAT enzyme Elp3 [Candidatus Magasanikbacteria bacterium]|uniref:tRNA carboxymethyluridine synthase n=1 Tax=Candidatus Magasanikbacteria bacterium CG10_big_fil_rev_8_21_14_0_10_38_6 TaxID=1974647 RepID=A0A2M6NZS9_9BACT|nr:tRNA uridine(34) 5-carboxymethylaminomethyl modification radical SAM/GNAT enzyme Elp3 [Candidatus Magasanikbacteria bacterium]PIR76938.1 MAG: hypothetical protein COU30_05150 [Candidatus Magasanikbacteria bacterium CG10_big_fil_rev_8_21_14_0_10_38_6]
MNNADTLEQIIYYIIEKKPQTKAKFDDLRRKKCSELKIPQPSNQKLLKAYHKLLKEKRVKKDENVEHFIRKANIRSLSGIAVITSLVKPYPCPGKCIYCPTEVRMPKSYIASEPAAARSLRLDFNPYTLMQGRINMLEKNGHPCDKIEYITKGGTWNAYTLKYQYWYILESFRACNNFTRRTPTAQTTEEDWQNKPLTALQDALEKEQRYNETAKHRIIGITLETRPDAITPKTIYHMRRQGCTRIELGLQAPDDNILTLVKRGHTVDQFRKAILLLRIAGFKVDLHFMPDLPGTTAEHDVNMYKRLFSDPSFKPDMIKIYPNTVIESAELFQWLKDGRYQSYGVKPLFQALLEMKRATPRYCRISRLIRDIPESEIIDGNKITNLRQDLIAQLEKNGETCVCLRCREIGRQIKNIPPDTVPQLFVDEYDTIGGREYFITFEDPKRTAVFGFLRLRLPNKNLGHSEKNKGQHTDLISETEITQLTTLLHIGPLEHTAFIRELHTYGQLVGIGKSGTVAVSQHKGLGKKLVQTAENIAKKHGYKKSAVISGVGVRGYYRKLGYKKQGTYVTKSLHND